MLISSVAAAALWTPLRRSLALLLVEIEPWSYGAPGDAVELGLFDRDHSVLTSRWPTLSVLDLHE